MTTDTTQRSVLLIGKSQRVLDDAVAGLRALGYKADATNDFTDVAGRFDAGTIDLIVFGGQVPPDRKAELKDELAAINPQIIFVQGLAGIPGLIVDQVQGAFTAHEHDTTASPTYAPADRSIRLTLTDPAGVKVTAWWQTAFVPPDPKSDSLLLLDDRLAAGEHAVAVPDRVPPQAAFATVQIDEAIHAFAIGAEYAEKRIHQEAVMPTPFGPQLIGETEKTLNALLHLTLEGTGLSEPQWVTLRIAQALDGSAGDAAGLATAVRNRAHFRDAERLVTDLTARDLLAGGTLAPGGRELVATVQARIAATAGSIWEDLPADDVAGATRILNEVVARARAVLA